MKPIAYYNEIDLYAAAWLRNLIAAGHIAPGVVDTRSIEDVTPDELREFTQCHFFAGIGVWSLALRRAGWSDDRPIWTGSCPCQPFSSAGKGAGFDDERHLWPAFHHLIKERRPAIVLGEQVAAKAVEPWIDLVHADLEAMGYAFGCIPFPSAGVGAPHIRDRAYWVANAENIGREGKLLRAGPGLQANGNAQDGDFGGLADNIMQQRPDGQPGVGNVDDANGWIESAAAPSGLCSDLRPGPINGLWRYADWLGCRDEKWRPVESRPQPMADGSSESLGRVCADAIKKIEEEINAWTVESQISRAEAMRNLLIDLGAQAQRSWQAGRVPGLHEAPFLLAFVRQLQEQGWRVAEGVALPCAEAAGKLLCVLRCNHEIAGSPHQRGLDGQHSIQSKNAVHFLSSLLARHAHTAWSNAHSTYAEIGFTLAHAARSRVGRLRAYGNAINAEAARCFIEALMEAA
jgi:hypothetical protein